MYVGNIYGSMSDLLQLMPLHLIVSQMQKKGPAKNNTKYRAANKKQKQKEAEK